jgi:hypothetical protein
VSARHPFGSLLAAVAVAVTTAGCGLLGASAHAPGGVGASGASSTSSTSSASPLAGPAAPDPGPAAIARTRRTHELRTPAGRVPVLGGWRTPVGAVTVFAATYVNWQASTIAARLRGLARVSLGQARSAMTTEAGEVTRDRELHAGGIANSGTVEAVAPIRGAPDEYAVITRERTSAVHDAAYENLAPAWHVALATVTRLAGGLWVLSGWQPEN